MECTNRTRLPAAQQTPPGHQLFRCGALSTRVNHGRLERGFPSNAQSFPDATPRFILDVGCRRHRGRCRPGRQRRCSGARATRLPRPAT